MKKLLLVAGLIQSTLTLTAQTDAERAKIVSQTNVAVLDSLSRASAAQYLVDLEKVKAYEVAHPGTTHFLNGSYRRQLMKFTFDGYPVFYATDNIDAARSTRTNYMHGVLGLNTEGQNMTISVWDGGRARTTHQEFTVSSANTSSRVTIGDAGELDDHATHVSGTIAARGAQIAAKGMAPRTSLTTFDWGNDDSEMSNSAAAGLLVSNHSYGTPMFVNGTFNVPDWFPGNYGGAARNVDIMAYNAPYYLIVASAGNEGNMNNPAAFSPGLDKLTGNKVAKNNLVVANAQDAVINTDGSLQSVSINGSSSIGPSDDLRIKPDITGNGTNVYSSVSTGDSDYDSYSGTSMASPNVAGSVLLLQQYYNTLNGSFMRSATLKGLACHTADDAGTEGPDPVFGWGLLNMKFASETITAKGTGSVISELSLANNATYTQTFSTLSAGKLMATICWTDVPGSSKEGQLNSAAKALVNDLDLRLTRVSDGTVYTPWKLNILNANNAVKGDNAVDNIERVEITVAEPGQYTLTVSHKGSITSGPQQYSLIVTGAEMQLSAPNYEEALNLSVYPNPASSELFFNSDYETPERVSIFDISGKAINCPTDLTRKSVDVSGLSNGIYFAQFHFADAVVTKKFLKK